MIKSSRITFSSITILLLLLLVIPGCSVLTPKTHALEGVHETYQNEFIQFMVPAKPGEKPNLEIAGSGLSFEKTLKAIREFRLKYGEGTESKHLQILEGMIYLQSGRFGNAKLLKDSVKAADFQLRSKKEGFYTRDYLLGMSFPYLIDGWQEIYDYNDSDDNTLAEYEKLETAADGIKQQLENLDQSDLSESEVDQGAVYLANSAAIFYTWVHALQKEEDRSDGTNWFARGRDLIGKFLTADEKQIATNHDRSSETISSGRLRYVEWYEYLNKEANNQ